MQEAIDRILRYAQGLSEAELCASEQALDACVWNLTVLGEAAKYIPPEVERAYPEIPWAQMRGIRNRIVHAYEEIDLEIIWNVVHAELPPLLPLLRRVMEEAAD